MNILGILKQQDKSLWDLDWNYIFEQWILYEAYVRKECNDDKEYLQSIYDKIEKDQQYEQQLIPRYQQSSQNPLEANNNDTDPDEVPLSPREKIFKLRQAVLDQRKLLQHADDIDRDTVFDQNNAPKRIVLNGKDKMKTDRAGYIRQRLKSRRQNNEVDVNQSEDDDDFEDVSEEEGDIRYRRARYKRIRQTKRRRRRRKQVQIGFTCERDVFRGTVGDTCYIVPLMYWIKVFGKDVMLERLRILQFELLVTKMDEYVAELLCFWDAATCDIPLEDIQIKKRSRPEGNDRDRKQRRRRYKQMDENGGYRIAATFRYQDNKNFPEFIIDENVLNDFNDLFSPCNERLIELLSVSGDMSDLMLLHDFDINYWDYQH